MRIPLLALVALTEDLPDHRLTRGQIGTVVEHLERDGDRALLVEFSDEQVGRMSWSRCGTNNCSSFTGIPKPPSASPRIEDRASQHRVADPPWRSMRLSCGLLANTRESSGITGLRSKAPKG
jgi:hypothetical protein